ncbi:MAG: SRPBCC domain-containing protein [Dehalococcoidia bacterium]
MVANIEVTVHEKEEDFMGGKYERTFVVAVPVERAWQAFVEREGREAWMSPPGRDPIENPDAEYPAPGFPKPEMKVGDVREHELLSWSNHFTTRDGMPGWVETTVTFEETGNGTRITVTRSGFGEGPEWDLFAQSTGLGWDDSMVDLVAYLETGVNVSRHFSGRSSIGAGMWESPAGLRVVNIAPDGFADEAGVQEGDLLVSIGGAGVYRRADVWFLQREHGPGEEMDVTYIRDSKLLRGRGRLSEKNYTETHGGSGA